MADFIGDLNAILHLNDHFDGDFIDGFSFRVQLNELMSFEIEVFAQ